MTVFASGCSATTMGDDYVYHTLEVIVDKDAGELYNVRYTYGAARVNITWPHARPGFPLDSFATRMVIPVNFTVDWETADGVKHEANVPVREALGESIQDKGLRFVIHHDRVEGFIGRYERYGMQIEKRFY